MTNNTIQTALDRLSSAYNPAEIEAGMYQDWENAGYFKPDYSKSKPFSISFPPPNVSGTLHMGYGFNNFIMDSLTL